MLYPRGSLAVTAQGDSVYAIGGFDSKEALNVVEVMDTRTMKWRSLQPLNTERAYGEATVVNDQVIVMLFLVCPIGIAGAVEHHVQGHCM